jgi:hypothetical protein
VSYRVVGGLIVCAVVDELAVWWSMNDVCCGLHRRVDAIMRLRVVKYWVRCVVRRCRFDRGG